MYHPLIVYAYSTDNYQLFSNWGQFSSICQLSEHKYLLSHLVNNDIIMDFNKHGSKVQNSWDDIEIIAGGQRFNAVAKLIPEK